MQGDRIRIATRGSPLALAQAREVRARLMAAHQLAEGAFEIRVIKTTGDRIVDRPLAEAGGKGLFTKEIEEALLAGEADIAVHSMKDMPTALPAGLEIGATPPREDVRDAFISLAYPSLAAMPKGAIVGTSSLRRHAQVKHARPDLVVVDFRGNVETRLRKLEQGLAQATFLACAGLKRLGLSDRITMLLPVEAMLPAVAQGAIAIEMRSGEARVARLLAPLNDEVTATAVKAERAFLARLEGSCRTAIAGYADIDAGALRLRGVIYSLDGARSLSVEVAGAAGDAEALGRRAADDLLDRGAAALVAGGR